jgi:hypothetical protein
MQYFTLAEAERLLPVVERHLRDALFHKAEFERAQREMQQAAERVRLEGGVRLNPARQLELRALRDTSVAALKQALAEIEKTGVLVKDLDIGLLDFMTRYRDRDVCLCWKLGEPAIRYWHGAEEGFRGRKEINEEFLRNHGPGAARSAPN